VRRVIERPTRRGKQEYLNDRDRVSQSSRVTTDNDLIRRIPDIIQANEPCHIGATREMVELLLEHLTRRTTMRI
jgi:hypothetical protein